MKYNPTDGEPDLLPEAWYDAALSAEEGVSKSSGKPMMTVTARVHHDALPVDVPTYFVHDVKAHMNRFKKLCAALGINFDAGEVTADMLSGKECKVQIKTQKSKDPQWDDKNVVAYFAPANSTPPDDGDIPF